MAAKEDFRSIEDVICEFINKDNVRFVFPSTVAMETWSDWAVKNSGRTGCKAVALEKWLVWDAFKNEFAQIRDSSKTCIPETLRKLFVRSLLHENSELVKNGGQSFLHPLISSSFAKNSLHFTSWLSAILPSLDLWNTKFTETHADNIEAALSEDDGENKVYAALYKRYADFLNKAGMFDPAWVKLNDIDQTYHFVIFHPEQLKDFNDYKEKIAQANATLVRLPPEQDSEHPDCLLYPNARMELRRTVLRIRELHEKQNVQWSDIALTVPNLETYRPYIERELKNYCIPFAMRSGLSYTQNCAGRVFEEIQNCFDSDFNLESVRTVLQDGFIPWRAPEINEAIVQTAIETRSICSYKQNGRIIDPIEEALAAKIADTAQEPEMSAQTATSAATPEPAAALPPETPEEAEAAKEKLALAQAALERYTGLKKCFASICSAKSFKAIKEAWHAFESGFLYDAKIWPNDKDNIVGICIAELTKYIAIEKEHSEKLSLKIEKPYEFFLDELNANIYTPQKPKNICISVFDYRAAADAYFDYHFVINANQKDLEVPFKELGFLSEKKRAELGASDNEGATEAYIRLYAKTGRDRVFFSSSTNSFDGFAISHTFFNEINILKGKDPTAYLDNEDFFLNEKKYLLEAAPENRAAPEALTKLQREAALVWQAKKRETQIDMNRVNRFLAGKAKESLVYDTAVGNSKFKISQTDLKNFFPCRRKWIFNKAAHLKEESSSVELMAHYDFGNICHKIVELIFEEFTETKKPLPVLDSDEAVKELRQKVETATEKALTEKDEWTRANDFKNSRLAVDMLLTQKHIFSDYIMSFMQQICSHSEKPGSGKFADYSVNSVEKSFSAKLNQSYELYGRIDCILSGNDEQGDVIIDYKTGKMPERKECYPDAQNTLNNFQMAFYYKLLSEQPKRYDVQDGLFYSLKKNSKDTFDKTYIISNADKTSKDGTKKIYTAEDFKENVVNLLDLYLKDFTTSIDSAGFEPLAQNKNERSFVKSYLHCASCDYNNICRTTFAVAKEEL